MEKHVSWNAERNSVAEALLFLLVSRLAERAQMAECDDEGGCGFSAAPADSFADCVSWRRAVGDDSAGGEAEVSVKVKWLRRPFHAGHEGRDSDALGHAIRGGSEPRFGLLVRGRPQLPPPPSGRAGAEVVSLAGSIKEPLSDRRWPLTAEPPRIHDDMAIRSCYPPSRPCAPVWRGRAWRLGGGGTAAWRSGRVSAHPARRFAGCRDGGGPQGECTKRKGRKVRL